MMQILRDLAPFNRLVCSLGYSTARAEVIGLAIDGDQGSQMEIQRKMVNSDPKLMHTNEFVRPPISVLLQRTVREGSLFAPLDVALGALLMAWPAFYNGFPLLYPDTLEYVSGGRRVAAAILLNHRSSFYGVRSLIYSLGILPFQLGGTIWPIVALQCLLTSWVLWLVFRSIAPRKMWIPFLVFMMLLSLLSSLSWYGAYVMPDILGPDLYLCIFLLLIAPDSTSRTERTTLYMISWWAIASHATHLLIAIAICIVLGVLTIFQRMPLRRYLGITTKLAMIFVPPIVAQVSLNAFLYGSPSLEGNHPPFFTARLIADGPGRWYLEKNCAGSGWEMCHYVDNLSGSSNRFLWGSDGVWANATSTSRTLILHQDLPLAIAILRRYPRDQFLRSAGNVVEQLATFNLDGFGPHPYISAHISQALPRAQWKYFESRQARNQLPLRLFDSIQRGTVAASLTGVGMLLPWFWRCRPKKLMVLGLVIAAGIVGNAIVTGTLSMVDGRFGSRVVWLAPFFAGLCFVRMAEDRRNIARRGK